MHGDEPAGVSSVMRIIDNLVDFREVDLLINTSIDFAPWVNPWGLTNGVRGNSVEIDINRDFVHLKTVEAQLLSGGVIQEKYDVALDLHESSDDNGFMIFAYHGSPPISQVVNG